MRISLLALFLSIFMAATAALPRPYDEAVDPLQQIDAAVAKAGAEGKNVICQVGGNWCRWCRMLAAYVQEDADVAKCIADNYEYIHVNYPTDGSAPALTGRLANAGRFGYPVLVVLDGATGAVIHIQDSSLLEEGQGYDKAKLLRFLQGWTPSALSTQQ